MRKNIFASIVVVMMLCMPIMAYAFGSLSDETIHPPVDTSSAPAFSVSPSTGDMEKIVNRTSRRVKALGEKTAKNTAEVSKNTAVVAKNTAAVTTMAKSVDGLTTVVGRSADAVKTQVKSLGNQAANIAWILGGLIVLVGIIVLIQANKTRNHTAEAFEPAINRFKETADKIEKDSTNVAATIGSAKDEILEAIKSAKDEIILEVPAKTAGINELQRSFVLKGIQKKDYRINPIMIDGKVRTLKLVKDLDEDDFDSPSKFPRTPAKDTTHLKATNAKMLAIFFDPSSLLKPTDAQWLAINNAINSGEVEEI